MAIQRQAQIRPDNFMVPIASSYAPINDLNASIMAQDARGQQAQLAQQEINNRMIAEAINAQVRQKQIAAESQDRQQHYGILQQQLANDMAARNQQFGLNKALGEAQIRGIDAAITNPKMDPSLIPAVVQRDEFNVGSVPAAGAANIALQAAKAKRDATVRDVGEGQSTWNPFRADFWRDVYFSNADWAKKAQDADALYREEIAKIAQATQGKAVIKNKVHPDTGAQIVDEYEAVPVTLPPLNFRGTTPQVQPTVQPQPQVAPPSDQSNNGFLPQSTNPFLNSPFMRQIMTGQDLGQAARLRYNLDGTLSPAQ